MTTLHLLGYASGVAAALDSCADGPKTLQQSPYLADLANHGIETHWELMLEPKEGLAKKEQVQYLCKELAQRVDQLVKAKKFFAVIGGDHSSAIGTWSGASHACKEQGPLGLIWIDAHMDSNTPETSPTGNIHGMPLACLLGQGDIKLAPPLNPNHVCLIGVRDYGAGEAELLKRLKVRVFYMDEVKERGLKVVMQEALRIVAHDTAHFGISIDIDGLDPEDAPGTGIRLPGGIFAKELFEVLKPLAKNPKLIGIEIAEFNPHQDIEKKTEKLIPELILALTKEYS